MTDRFLEGIKKARKHIAKMCKVHPELYPQYQNWQAAKQALKVAKTREAAAKKVWDEFRKP